MLEATDRVFSITMTSNEYLKLRAAIHEVGEVISDAAGVFAFFRRLTDDDDEQYTARAIARLSHMALLNIEEQEVATLRRFCKNIKEASLNQQIERKETA